MLIFQDDTALCLWNVPRPITGLRRTVIVFPYGVVHFTLPVIFHVFHLPVNIDMIFIEGHELRTMSAVMTARAEIEKRS